MLLHQTLRRDRLGQILHVPSYSSSSSTNVEYQIPQFPVICLLFCLGLFVPL